MNAVEIRTIFHWNVVVASRSTCIMYTVIYREAKYTHVVNIITCQLGSCKRTFENKHIIVNAHLQGKIYCLLLGLLNMCGKLDTVSR